MRRLQSANNTILICAWCDALQFPEHAYKVIHIAEAALCAYGPYIVARICQQLFGQTDAGGVDIFKRAYPELFLEPFKEYIAAQVGFAA